MTSPAIDTTVDTMSETVNHWNEIGILAKKEMGNALFEEMSLDINRLSELRRSINYVIELLTGVPNTLFLPPNHNVTSSVLVHGGARSWSSAREACKGEKDRFIAFCYGVACQLAEVLNGSALVDEAGGAWDLFKDGPFKVWSSGRVWKFAYAQGYQCNDPAIVWAHAFSTMLEVAHIEFKDVDPVLFNRHPSYLRGALYIAKLKGEPPPSMSLKYFTMHDQYKLRELMICMIEPAAYLSHKADVFAEFQKIVDNTTLWIYGSVPCRNNNSTA